MGLHRSSPCIQFITYPKRYLVILACVLLFASAPLFTNMLHPVHSSYCGDGFCRLPETCQTCDQDCGPCSSPCQLGIPNYITMGIIYDTCAEITHYWGPTVVDIAAICNGIQGCNHFVHCGYQSQTCQGGNMYTNYKAQPPGNICCTYVRIDGGFVSAIKMS